ncbi:hypothetical protein B0J14DRAFT_493464, partial [Halenospora varia]
PSGDPLAQQSTSLPNLCSFCQRKFDKVHELNTHLKSHTLPFKCAIPPCGSQRFRYLKDLERHNREKHPESVPGSNRHYCPHPSCKYSNGGLKDGFPRLDNYRRHMKVHDKEKKAKR